MQRVALKVIKAGMDTKAVIARFEQERQALAMMDHPNVAKVHDAGVTGAGRPYFVMEHVAGEPITAYCDKHRLTLRQRLELFIPVCEAIQHAHHKGIIHRDLKPSNILVCVRDEQGVPKVIDFGVAKAMSQTLTDKTIFTETGQLIGTPEYMSPEQAEMRGGDVDTRSDVYSLGAVLYELLTGEVPFDAKALRSGGYEGIRKVIREIEPPKPSTRLISLAADTSAAIAQHRRIEHRDLALELKRELDWIPLKALRKDRTERYSNPTDLARDIRNYLEGKPLQAGPESAGYRVRKLMKRNKGAFAAATAIVAALVIGVVGFAWQAHRVRIQRDAALAARDAEASERHKAEAIANFIETALQSTDSTEGGQPNMRVDELMLKAVTQIDSGAFKDEPEIEARLLSTIAGVLRNNGRPSIALPMAQRSLAIHLKLHLGDDLNLAYALREVGLVLIGLHRFEEAIAYLVRAADMYQSLLKRDDYDLANARQFLGNALTSVKRFKEAETFLTMSLEMKLRLSKGDSAQLVTARNDLAVMYETELDYTRAEQRFREALTMARRVYPGDHVNIATTSMNLANTLLQLGRAVEAEPFARTAEEMYERVFKADNHHTAWGLRILGSILFAEGRTEEADPLLTRALEMFQRIEPGDSLEAVVILAEVTDLRIRQNKLNEAETLTNQRLAMSRRLYQGDHVEIANSQSTLAGIRLLQERPEEAESLYRELMQMIRRAHQVDDFEVGVSRIKLANALIALGRGKEAMQLAGEGVAILEKVRSPTDPALNAGRTMLAVATLVAAHHAEALRSVLGKNTAFWFNYNGEPHLWSQPDADHWEEAYPDGKVSSFVVDRQLTEGEFRGTIVQRLPERTFEVLIPAMKINQPLNYRPSAAHEWKSLGGITPIR